MDPVHLHEASIQGRLFEYLGQILVLTKKKKKITHLWKFFVLYQTFINSIYTPPTIYPTTLIQFMSYVPCHSRFAIIGAASVLLVYLVISRLPYAVHADHVTIRLGQCTLNSFVLDLQTAKVPLHCIANTSHITVQQIY